MTTYNRKQIMQNAWCIARDAVVKFGGKAREYLSLALKEIWSTIKNGVKKMTNQEILDSMANALQLKKGLKAELEDNFHIFLSGGINKNLEIVGGKVNLNFPPEIANLPEVIAVQNMINKIGYWVWRCNQYGAKYLTLNVKFEHYDTSRDAVITKDYIAIPVRYGNTKWIVYGLYGHGEYNRALNGFKIYTDDLPQGVSFNKDNTVIFSYIWDVEDTYGRIGLRKFQNDFKNFFKNKPVYNPHKKHFVVEATEEELQKIKDEDFRLKFSQPTVRSFIKFLD